MKLELNKWHRLAIHNKWSQQQAEGKVDVWFNGSQVVSGAAATKYDANELFFQMGLHRSDPSPPVQVIYIDAAMEATTEAEILMPLPEPRGAGGTGGNTGAAGVGSGGSGGSGGSATAGGAGGSGDASSGAGGEPGAGQGGPAGGGGGASAGTSATLPTTPSSSASSDGACSVAATGAAGNAAGGLVLLGAVALLVRRRRSRQR